MNDYSKQIHDWHDRVKESFQDEGKLHDYLINTMDNFLYRYLETTENKNLRSMELAPYIYGAESFESNMALALKTNNPEAKEGIMELARRVPKSQKPLVKYRLQAQVMDLRPEKGHLMITSFINWDFPHFFDKTKTVKKEIEFKYKDLSQFRKELALKLDEACELFN